MVYGGISLRGSYHEVNQDSYVCKMYGPDCGVMVVSDGMGSKKFSQYGSKAICESVCETIGTLQSDLDALSFGDVIALCHEKWKSKLAGYDITQCCTTLLVLVVTGRRIKAARLGDGFLAIHTEKGVRVLFDRKENCFANETDCLSEVLARDRMEILDESYEIFHGAVSCTDGIEIGTMREEELQNFAGDFIAEYSSQNADDIQREVYSWVAEWPGRDDKTLAFLLGE